MHVKAKDKVIVLAGKDRGKTGQVQRVYRERNRVVVEKLNMIKRHTKPSEANRTGGIVEKEAPLNASNVALYCDACAKGVRTQARWVGEGGTRYSDRNAALAAASDGSVHKISKIRVCVGCDASFD